MLNYFYIDRIVLTIMIINNFCATSTRFFVIIDLIKDSEYYFK